MKKFFLAALAASMMVAPVASVQAAPKAPVIKAQTNFEQVQYRPGYRQVTRTEWVRAPNGRMVKREVKRWEPAPRVQQRYQAKRWNRGERVNNWRNYQRVDHRRHAQLRTPPRNHQWVKVNNDYLLIAIGSGLIASVIAGR